MAVVAKNKHKKQDRGGGKGTRGASPIAGPPPG